MPRYCYRFRVGVKVEPEADGRYRIRLPDSDRKIQLAAPALAPLLFFDGQRGADEVLFRFGVAATQISQSDLDTLVRSMAGLGVLEEVGTRWKPLSVYPAPVQRCVGCGASCQGHWIGPLQPEFIERTAKRMPQLRAKYPHLADQKPFVRINPKDNALFLNSQSGQCLFLDTDMGCILHRELGADEKPTICQKFPHVRVEDGSTMRMAVGLMCMKHAVQVMSDEEPASSARWEELNEALDGRLYQYFPPDASVGIEGDLFEAARGEDDPLLVVLDRLVGRKLRPSQVDVARRLDSMAYGFLARLERNLAADAMVRAMCTLNGVLPRTMAAIRALARKDPYTQRVPVPVRSAGGARTPRRLKLLGDMLRRYLFLRQYLLFESVEQAMAAFTLGIWVALRLEESGPDGDERLGELLATWHRALQSPGIRLELFARPSEASSWLVDFLRFWRCR